MHELVAALDYPMFVVTAAADGAREADMLVVHMVPDHATESKPMR